MVVTGRPEFTLAHDALAPAGRDPKSIHEFSVRPLGQAPNDFVVALERRTVNRVHIDDLSF